MPFPSLSRPWLARAGILLAVISAAACSSSAPAPAGPDLDARERAYRANNVGVALLEQLKYPEAATAFREALTIDPTLAMGHLNLSLALMYEQDLDGAAREATDASGRMPTAPQPPYVQGLIARAQNRNDDARRFLERVRQLDPDDVGAAVNLAQIDLEDRRYEAAAGALQPIVAREPYHVTAAYVLGLALTRSGKADEGQQLLQRAQDLRRASYAVTFGTGYLEQGRYAEALASTGAEPDLVDHSTPAAKFTPIAIGSQAAASGTTSPFGRRFQASELDAAGARALAASLGGGQTLADIDGDGTLELIVVGAGVQRLFRRAAGGWSDATNGSGLDSVPAGAVGIGVISADFDNDGSADLFVLRASGSALYKNDGKGHFSDVTRAAKLPAYPALPGAAAFVDVDHDGDVDLLIAGVADVAATRRQGGGSFVFPGAFAPAPVQLLRNNGNGTFTDITRTAGLERRGHAIAIVPTDFDNHRDIDLLIVNSDGPPQLYANQRDGTFKDVAASVGLDAAPGAGESTTAVAVGDVNKDDWPDFFIGRTGESVFALSDGRGRFNVSAAPRVGARRDRGAVCRLRQRRVARPGGDRRPPVSSCPERRSELGGRDHVCRGARRGRTRGSRFQRRRRGRRWRYRPADVRRGGGLAVAEQRRPAQSIAARAAARPRVQSHRRRRQGAGARRQPVSSPGNVRGDAWRGAGRHRVRPRSAPGRRGDAGALAVRNSAGRDRGGDRRTGPSACSTSPFVVEELDRKPSSCPFLFAWNGERFEFMTDFLGGGEMGYRESRRRLQPPRSARIRADPRRSAPSR